MITIPVVTERCGAIDVGKRGLAVAVALGPADKETEIKTRAYGTTVPALLELKSWLSEQGCTAVALESTGSYWIPVKNILEGAFQITLVCARKHHPKKGEKTDFRDAIDMVIHHRHGLLTGSYLPERGIVELRDLTRRRKKLLGNMRAEKNRIQKVLETANVKIGNVVSDVFGVSGQEILQALLRDEPLTAEELADKARARLRDKIPQLTDTLEAHQMNDHHRWLIDQSIEHAKCLDRQIEELEKKIDEHLQPYQRQYELLMTIPGIKAAAAANILAEIGADMSQFPDGDHLSSWAGICPGNNESAGKRKSSHIEKANKFLLAALVEASWGAVRKKDSAMQRKFHRWLRAKGAKKATVAIAHGLLKVIWSVLKHDRPFVEPDALVLRALEREKQVRHCAQRLRQLGADEQAIANLTKILLEAPLPGSPEEPAIAAAIARAPTDAACASRPTCSLHGRANPPAKHRRVARGVLGFRIRTAEKKQYAVVKDLPGAPHTTTPPETTKLPKLSRNAKGRSPKRE